ncbi:MAG: murein DD-endopeptidase MepM/ murein hydrolase activator NlpD, partial [Myxococcota bacterium]
ANYFVFFHDGEVPSPPALQNPDSDEATPTETEPRRPTAPESEPAPASDTGTTVVRNFEGKLNRGDTVFMALQNQGIENTRVAPIMAAMRKVFDFRKAQVGDVFKGQLDASGRLVHFEYHLGPLDVFSVDFKDDQYVASKIDIPVDIRLARVGCTIGTSLFASLTRCGEGPELASKVSELFQFDVDFLQEIRSGDVIRLVVEKVYIDGRFMKYDKVLAARYEGKFGTHAAYHYTDKSGSDSYYTESGRALKKEFLKTPLKYTRISSGFTHRRFHPTLHRWRKHLAIDYAAPMNTPVQAVASGKVKYVGKKGASGNLVTIEHSGGYLSYYAHLNKFGRIEVGDKVGQSTVIGYVGKTGRATGPHLHFALKRHSKWVNPQNVKFTTASVIDSGEQKRFEKAIDPLKDALRQVEVQGLSDRQG